MSKFTLLVLAVCVLFGLPNLVTSDHSVTAPEEDIEVKNEEVEISERMLVPKEKVAPNTLYRPGTNQYAVAQVNQRPPATQMSLVDCYSCTDCPKVLANTTTKLCPVTLNPAHQGCVVYAEKYRYMNKPWYIRGCASERGSCADIVKSHSNYGVALLFCDECNGDRCNTNGAHSITNFNMAFLVLVVTPLIGKFTFS